MRIDRYLHCIRLVKSRTLAQALVEEGLTRIDGKRVLKASEQVRIGSVVALPLHDQVRVIRVLTLPTRRGPASEARLAYEDVSAGRGRPTMPAVVDSDRQATRADC
ncbi:MAG: RNA-binding S4 domain-containing protein [Sphingomicrobium sp.]|nr:RNA-binding S4 domain-containing protein [Sphingomonadales bacterium]